MSDNPFAEPDDDNRTVIRPTPGRRRPQPGEPASKVPGEPPPRQDAPAPRSVAMAEGTENISIGGGGAPPAPGPRPPPLAAPPPTPPPPPAADLREPARP